MDKVFCRLPQCIDLLLAVLDEARLKSSTTTVEHTIDPGLFAINIKAKDQQFLLSAEVEAFFVFGKACGEVSRWQTGCSCHDLRAPVPVNYLRAQIMAAFFLQLSYSVATSVA